MFYNMILLPQFPRSIHKLQQLDWGFVGQLKIVYAAEAAKWYTTTLGLQFHSDICHIFWNACEKIANVNNAKEAFQVTGLEPFNSDMFSDDDFLPSDVGNWL